MAAKKKFSFKKKEKVEEIKAPVIEEEKAVDTVVEEEIKVEEIVEPKKVKDDVVWNVGWTNVHIQPRWIRFQKFDAPVPMCMIKDLELRRYLNNNGFGTNVYQKDKEWLEKHHADMKMIERLKKYVTGI